jgi:hypothetical protein
MFQRIVGASFLIVLAGLFLSEPAGVQQSKDKEPTLADLSLEVNALRTLYHLEATPEQLQALQKLAKETAQKSRQRDSKGSKDYRQALINLRGALVAAKDEDQIDKFEEKLTEIQQNEEYQIDDEVEVTDAARRRTPEVLKLFKEDQVKTLAETFDEEAAKPADYLVKALVKVRELKPEEWEEHRDEVASEVSQWVGGIDAKKYGRTHDQVIALLNKAHGLKDADFEKQQPELEKTARQIVGNLKEEVALRNKVEHTVAELLSNPCLEAALKARLSK